MFIYNHIFHAISDVRENQINFELLEVVFNYIHNKDEFIAYMNSN